MTSAPILWNLMLFNHNIWRPTMVVCQFGLERRTIGSSAKLFTCRFNINFITMNWYIKLSYFSKYLVLHFFQYCYFYKRISIRLWMHLNICQFQWLGSLLMLNFFYWPHFNYQCICCFSRPPVLPLGHICHIPSEDLGLPPSTISSCQNFETSSEES